MLAALLLSLAQPGLPEIVRLRPPPAPETRAEAKAETEKSETPPPAETPPESPKDPEPAKAELPLRASLTGEWTLGLVRRGTLCRITLSNQAAGPGIYIASLGDNCPQSLFAVSRWRLTTSALTLANRSGRPLARLFPKDGGWQGPTLDSTGREGPDAMMEKATRR